MNTKCFIISTSGLLLAGSTLAQTSKPNVIIIYTDDQGTLDAGCYGATDLYTPHLIDTSMLY